MLWVPQSERTLPHGSSLRVGGLVLKTSDFITIKEKSYVNDQIINAFLGVLEANYPPILALPSYEAMKWQSQNYLSFAKKTVLTRQL